MFYGWTLVAVTFYTQFVVMGTVFYSHGILFKPIAEEIGGTRFQFSLALPIFFIVSGLMGPIIGYVLQRYPVRNVMLLGAGILSLGFFLLSRADSILMFYFSFGVVMSVGVALLGGITNTVLVSNWFERKRGTALGVSQFGVSMSGMVMAYLTPWLVGLYTWRGTSEIYALAPILLVAPIVWWLVVTRPEDKGLRPDGDAAPADSANEEIDSAPRWSAKQIFRSANFWCIVTVIGLNFTVSGTMILKIFPYATDLGYSSEQASLALALMAGIAALGKPTFGWLGDRMNKKVAMLTIMTLESIGLALLISADSHFMMIVGAAIFGLGYGGLMPMWGVLIGSCFGRQSFGLVMGLMGPMIVPFQLLGVPFADWMYDSTGTYSTAFTTFFALYAIAIIALFFIRLPVTNKIMPNSEAAIAAN
ncbi:MAG: MFS transporter [Pseudomonadota bacterium]